MKRGWLVWTRRAIGALDLLITLDRYNTYREQLRITYPTLRKAKE